MLTSERMKGTVSQLHLIFGPLTQSHSSLCSFACMAESEAHLRPWHQHFLRNVVLG